MYLPVLAVFLLAGFGGMALLMAFILRKAETWSALQAGLLVMLVSLIGAFGIAFGVMWMDEALKR